VQAGYLLGLVEREWKRQQVVRVSVGLPVYNGERYLEATIDSLLGQSLGDFELVIADNASQDGTQDICKAAEKRDRRVRYIRRDRNVGIARNFNGLFEITSTPFFKWASHDDICGETFLADSVRSLDEDPDAVLACGGAAMIDSDGTVMFEWPCNDALMSSDPLTRLRAVLRLSGDIFYVFGLVRRDALRRTKLLGEFIGSDRALLSSLALLGKFNQPDGGGFFMREHKGRSIYNYNWRDAQSSILLYDPDNKGRTVYPNSRLLREHLGSVLRSPLPLRNKARCIAELVGWARQQAPAIRNEVAEGLGRSRYLSPLLPVLARAKYHIERLVPVGETLILIDDEKADIAMLRGRSIRPFLEKDGQYWGPPEDSEAAVREVERMRAEGAKFVILAWTSFWWLETYPAFFGYLRDAYRLAYEDRSFLAFDLSSSRNAGSSASGSQCP
jgi:glycosyltransferase involved in cell wall biosynthesis